MGQDVALDGTGNGGGQHAQLEPGITTTNITLSHPNRNAFVNTFFNTAAFVPVNNVPLGTYGNAGRGLISGPAFNSSDFSVLKDFALREPMKVAVPRGDVQRFQPGQFQQSGHARSPMELSA